MADFDSPHVQENFTNASPMEILKKKFPALPSNYVTLQQLQERRLKELQQVKEKEEEERKQQQQLQEKEKEREEEEERKRLLQESLQALIINASSRRSRKQGDKFSAVEKEADGPDKAIEESRRKRKEYWNNRKKRKEKVALSPVECIQAPEKSAGNGKSPTSDRPERGDGTEKTGLENGGDRPVEIAPGASGMRFYGQKEARQRRNAGKKCGNQKTGRINLSMQGKQSEKIEWKEKSDQTVEQDDKMGDPGSNDGKEEGPMNLKKIERKDSEDRMVEVAHEKGDDGIVGSNMSLGKKGAWKEVDNKSTAEMKFGYGRNQGKIVARGQKKIRKNNMVENAQKVENFKKKDGVDPMVEIAQKVADVVVDRHQMVELDDKISDPGSNGGKEKGLMNPKKIEREDTEDRMVEVAHEKGDDGIVGSNLTLEKKGVWKEVDSKSRAEMKFSYRRNRGKIATRSQEKIRKNDTVYRMMENTQKVAIFEKKDGVDPMVEIAQKVSDVVVDRHQTVEEVEGRKEADERTKAEMRRGFHKYHEKTRAPLLEKKDRARKQRAGNLVWVRKGEI